MREELFESVLDDISSEDSHKKSAEIISQNNDDEWFGRDEDWLIEFEYKSTVSDVMNNNGKEFVYLWEKMMETFNCLNFIDSAFTLIFEFQWENASWQTENYVVETTEMTTLEKFKTRFYPMIEKMFELAAVGCLDMIVFLGVSIKFENTSKVHYHRFKRELGAIYNIFIRNYKENKVIEPVWIKFIENRMNNESSDEFCQTDTGSMFTERQMKAAYYRIFERDRK